jgi:hypothetical protein
MPQPRIVATARLSEMATSLAPRNAARDAGLVRISPAVPRSFSHATVPIASSSAQTMPNCERFLRICAASPASEGGGRMVDRLPASGASASSSSFM